MATVTSRLLPSPSPQRSPDKRRKAGKLLAAPPSLCSHHRGSQPTLFAHPACMLLLRKRFRVHTRVDKFPLRPAHTLLLRQRFRQKPRADKFPLRMPRTLLLRQRFRQSH